MRKAAWTRWQTSFELRIIGFDNEEIAAEIGASRATVKRDLKQARAFLAYQLGLPAGWLSA